MKKRLLTLLLILGISISEVFAVSAKKIRVNDSTSFLLIEGGKISYAHNGEIAINCSQIIYILSRNSGNAVEIYVRHDSSDTPWHVYVECNYIELIQELYKEDKHGYN